MCGLHALKTGGILGDDMGLGKTVQVCALFSLLFHSGLARRCLLVLPVAVVCHWQQELRRWCPAVPVHDYTGGLASRGKAHLLCRQRGGILLATYGTVTSRQGLRLHDGEEEDEGDGEAAQGRQDWDALVLDEGHRLKNCERQGWRAVRRIRCCFRLLLTGTPIQNSLQELWSLMQLACCGRLLGDRTSYRDDWALPIQCGQDREATARQRSRAQQLTDRLSSIIRPHFLRREKKDVHSQLQQSATVDAAASCLLPSAAAPAVSAAPLLSARKNDLIVWLHLSCAQSSLYSGFISSPAIKAALNSSRSPLAALTVLKKICDHPRLLSRRLLGLAEQQQQQRLSAELEAAAAAEEDEEERGGVDAVHEADVEQLLAESCKLAMLLRLVLELRAAGHRLLIFSQHRRMLDIVALVLSSRRLRFLRMDGTVRSREERQRRIAAFSSSSGPEACSCFLLTTGVGSVGLNLTAADRCLVFDPSWNPAVDNQSVDRCHRIGQQRDVVVYRFITCGTVEETIYRKQVFKQGLVRSISSRQDAQPDAGRDSAGCGAVELREGRRRDEQRLRYFTRQELREVFSLRDPRHSVTQRQLAALHPPEHRSSYAELDSHIAWLQQQPDVFGLSDHDLLFGSALPGLSSAGAAQGGLEDGDADGDGCEREAQAEAQQAMARLHSSTQPSAAQPPPVQRSSSSCWWAADREEESSGSSQEEAEHSAPEPEPSAAPLVDAVSPPAAPASAACARLNAAALLSLPAAEALSVLELLLSALSTGPPSPVLRHSVLLLDAQLHWLTARA